MLFSTYSLLILSLLFGLLFLLLVKERESTAQRKSARARFRGQAGPVRRRVNSGVACLLGRKVRAWSLELGGEGADCPGYFGLEMAGPNPVWLVLAQRNAAEWLLCNGRWVAAPTSSHHEQRPLYHNHPAGSWDRLSEKLVGGIVRDVQVSQTRFRVILEHGLERVILEVPSDTDLLPCLPSGRPRRRSENTDLRRALFLAPTTVREEVHLPTGAPVPQPA